MSAVLNANDTYRWRTSVTRLVAGTLIITCRVMAEWLYLRLHYAPLCSQGLLLCALTVMVRNNCTRLFASDLIIQEKTAHLATKVRSMIFLLLSITGAQQLASAHRVPHCPLEESRGVDDLIKPCAGLIQHMHMGRQPEGDIHCLRTQLCQSFERPHGRIIAWPSSAWHLNPL